MIIFALVSPTVRRRKHRKVTVRSCYTRGNAEKEKKKTQESQKENYLLVDPSEGSAI